ncbi:MAG: TIGR04255 family protein [Actinobacteria bacterium]|nr:TIGR04255 family protein [Actinomycetota bacterium]
MIDEPFGAAVPSVPLSRSPLTFVVAQVRIPLVVSISEESFIGPFQEQVRSTYGDLRREDEAQILLGPDGLHNVQGGVVWRFSDAREGWEVALAPEFVALATNDYTNREDFLTRLGQLVAALDAWLHPQKVRRLGVRYIDRVQEQDHLQRLRDFLRPEVLGPYKVPRPEAVTLNNVLTDCDYRFSDDSVLRARWGFLGPKTTFDPAIAPVDSPSWVLDLDASHGERDFDVTAITDQVQLFTDRIYRYFRWAVTDDFLTAYGADS